MWSVLVVVFCVIGSVQSTILSDCHLPKQYGGCKASFLRYYFNVFSKQCKTFRYGGCGGNGNNFRTLKECQEKCMAKPKFCLHCCGPPPCCNTCDQISNPGFCPPVPPGTIGTCVVECSSDEGCPSDKKCCSNGCGRVCTVPISPSK